MKAKLKLYEYKFQILIKKKHTKKQKWVRNNTKVPF